MSEKALLHIYGQFTPHDEAILVGNKTALVRLRDAINQALEISEGSTGCSNTDETHYRVLVKLREQESFYKRVACPYTAPHYANDGLDPRDPEADA